MIVSPKTLRELDLAFLNLKNHPSFEFARWTSKHSFDAMMRDIYLVKANFFHLERREDLAFGVCDVYMRGQLTCVAKRIQRLGRRCVIASVSPGGPEHTLDLLRRYAKESLHNDFQDDASEEVDDDGEW